MHQLRLKTEQAQEHIKDRCAGVPTGPVADRRVRVPLPDWVGDATRLQVTRSHLVLSGPVIRPSSPIYDAATKKPLGLLRGFHASDQTRDRLHGCPHRIAPALWQVPPETGFLRCGSLQDAR